MAEIIATKSPYDEIDDLDRMNVQTLLATAARYKAAFMHPHFQNDPACRLAKQLASAQVGPELCDAIVVNGGYSPQDGVRPIACHHTPLGNMTDYLAAGSRPRPVWMAWYPQAKAALEALKKLEEA